MFVDVSERRSSILFVYHLLSKANLARFSDRVRTDLLATGRTLSPPLSLCVERDAHNYFRATLRSTPECRPYQG